MYIWDCYLSDMAQTKVCKYKQGGLALDRSGNLWQSTVAPGFLLFPYLSRYYTCELVIA